MPLRKKHVMCDHMIFDHVSSHDGNIYLSNAGVGNIDFKDGLISLNEKWRFEIESGSEDLIILKKIGGVWTTRFRIT